VSLLWRRRSIERAVAGLLPVADERRLREHLGRCPGCQSHYDRLSLAARALAGDASVPSSSAASRQRARLVLALTGATGGPVARSRRRVLAIGAPAVAAVGLAGLWLALRPPITQPDAVTWRGPVESQAATVRASLLVFASPKGAAERRVHMVAEFPGSVEGTVSADEYVQFTYRHGMERAFVNLWGVDAAGAIRRYFPRPGSPATPLPPTRDARPLGPSVDLGRHPVGPLRLHAFFSDGPLDEGRVRDALARREGSALGAHEITGTLLVKP
jgi:hypothetical protein